MSYNGKHGSRQHKAYSDGGSTDSTAADMRGGAFSDAFSRDVSGSSGSGPDTEAEGSPMPLRSGSEHMWAGPWRGSFPEDRLRAGGTMPGVSTDGLRMSGAIAPPPGLGPETGGQDHARDGALRSLQNQVGQLQRELENLMAHMEHQSDSPVGGKPWQGVVTVMMRNLPNKYTQRMLKSEIDAAGFDGAYDFLYLPIDRLYGANKGYAFINFVAPEHVGTFRSCFDGRPMNCFKSHKVVSVVPASWQGYAANYKHFYNASVNHGDPEARPLFLREQLANAKKQRPLGPQHVRPLREDTGYPQVVLPPKADFCNEAGGSPYFYPPPLKAAMHIPLPQPPCTAAPAGWDAPTQQLRLPRERKFCTACGARVPPTASFCTDCGQRLPVLF
eukprot:TRINITY_DN76209_c0_g1_i1.p1 TRINITY_DN76209_c0_g1~~TRINITY_DN76209_c0_g1_i1.p1  ORF type:complete len:418 (+),score=64.37 TRINITY_DN76209_c0_g1_i1:96-1256(+)